ncbi:MAG: hypothetical protein E7482_05915 [Ruminococcaceae bacterium]|nr:hypothetical protein [Oscillospiraceae bacterium]
MSNSINAIETRYNGYKFRSRLEAKWAVFFDSIGLDYEYEVEGFEMDNIRYLPDFYIPSLDRWFEVKGQPLSITELQKCEQFCFRKDNKNIKFSILIGMPTPAMYKDDNIKIIGISEFTWEWPSELYPADMRIFTLGLTKEEYYSRFVPGIWKVPNVTDKQLTQAIRAARESRFEFGETPKGR